MFFFSHQTLHSDTTTTYLCIQLMLCDPSQILVVCLLLPLWRKVVLQAQEGLRFWLLLVEEGGWLLATFGRSRIFQKGASRWVPKKKNPLNYDKNPQSFPTYCLTFLRYTYTNHIQIHDPSLVTVLSIVPVGNSILCRKSREYVDMYEMPLDLNDEKINIPFN